MFHSRMTRSIPHWLMASMLMGMVACSQAQDPDRVSLEQAREDLKAGSAVLIDLREPNEHARGVAPGAVRLPLSQLSRRWSEVPVDASKPVYLICATQNRSRAALQALREQGGYSHVRYVHGGMSGWAAQGWPLSNGVN